MAEKGGCAIKNIDKKGGPPQRKGFDLVKKSHLLR
jgi:hypothetical protein